MTYDEFISEALRLRRAADDAQHRLMRFLWDVEQTPEIWADSGLTFMDIVKRNDLCDANRYRQWRVAYEDDPSLASSVGIYAVLEAGKMNDPRDRRELLQEAKHLEAKKQTSCSQETAGKLGKGIRERKRAEISGRKGRHDSWLTLHKRVERLQERVSKLELENGALRAEVKGERKARKSAERQCDRLKKQLKKKGAVA